MLIEQYPICEPGVVLYSFKDGFKWATVKRVLVVTERLEKKRLECDETKITYTLEVVGEQNTEIDESRIGIDWFGDIDEMYQYFKFRAEKMKEEAMEVLRLTQKE